MRQNALMEYNYIHIIHTEKSLVKRLTQQLQQQHHTR